MSEEKKVNKKNNKKPNAFARFFINLGKKCKDMFSEIKNVTWPKLPLVVKQTGVVLGVILLFLIFVTAVDAGLNALLSLINA